MAEVNVFSTFICYCSKYQHKQSDVLYLQQQQQYLLTNRVHCSVYQV